MTRKFGTEDIVNRMYHRLLEITAADSGLVCDEHGLHSRVIDPPDCGSGVAERLVQAGIIHVSDFFGYGSVTVDEDSLVHMGAAIARPEKSFRTDHPVCAFKGGFALFLDAQPPLLS